MAQSAWLTEFLASLESGTSGGRQPTTQELAADIIRRSNQHRYGLERTRSYGYGAPVGRSKKAASKTGGPSTVQRVMDVLSRPLYGAAEAVKQDIKHGGLIDDLHFGGIGDESGEFENIVKGAALGVAGKRKTTSRDVYKAAGLGEGEGWQGFARNLATDIALDPLTWVPGGALVNLARKGKAVAPVEKVGTATERVEKALNKPKIPTAGQTGVHYRQRGTIPSEGSRVFVGESPRQPLAIEGPKRRLYRSEARRADEDLNVPTSVGIHWTSKPIDYGYGSTPERQQRVVWHADVPESAIDTSVKRSRREKLAAESEGEVILKPGTKITLHGRTVRTERPGYVDVKDTPEIPMSRTIVIGKEGETLSEAVKKATVAPSVTPTPVAEVLADVVPKPTRQIDVAKLGTPPRAAVAKPVGKKFKLDVNKIASIEIARAVGPKLPQASKEFQAGENLVQSGGKIPLYSLMGKEQGSFDAAKIKDYLRTGKLDIPKETEIPHTIVKDGKLVYDATPEDIAKFESYLFTEKDAATRYYVKNIDENGNEVLRSLKQVRDDIVKTKKARKLKDEIPDEVVETTGIADTTAWRKAAKEAGLTKSEIEKVLKTTDDDEALRLLQEFADKPLRMPKPRANKSAPVEGLPDIEDFRIADAEDIVDAVGEGSETAAKAMVDAVEAQRPRTRQVIDEAGGRAVAKVAEKYAALVRKATFKNKFFNPAKQANAFRELEKALVDEGLLSGFTKIPKEKLITTSTGKAATARRSLAMKHLEALEDAMTHAGYPPTMYNGVPLRMSDLINAAGGVHVVLAPKGMHLTDLVGNPQKLEEFLAAHPEAAQLAEKAKAAHAAYTANLVDSGKRAALSSASKAEMDPSKTVSEVAEAYKEAPKVAEQVVKASADLPNPEAARMAADNVREIIELAKPSINRAVEQGASSLNRSVRSGVIDLDTIKVQIATQKAALATAGIRTTDIATEISKAGDSAASQGLMAGLMKTFKPDFRQQDLRPIFVENRSLFQTNTARWSHALNETFRKYNKGQRITAFSSLQKGLPVGDDVTKQAADEFNKAMDSMFGASGVKNAVTTDVIREAITMDDLNKALRMRKSAFQFDTKVVNEFGEITELDDWMDAWKYHDLKGQDPVEFIKEMRDAVDRAMMEKTMFDQIATIWGKPTGKSQFKHPRLSGIEFDADIKPQVARFLEVLDEVNNPNSKFALQYDTALRAWKSGVTIYSPSHHVRNMVGDVFLAWLAGVNNPRVYSKAASVIKSQRHLYDDMAKIDELVAPGGTQRAIAQQARQPIVRAAGKKLNAEQVYKIMYDRGLLPHSKTVEDIPHGVVDELKIPKPLGGRGRNVARGVSETREHFVRTAHFIDALGKSKAKSLNQAIDEATRITRKWHPDGLDLTEFEHRWMRRAFPFYSWTRKAVPLMVEGAVKKPAKITAPNKVLYNLQVSMGIDPESMSEPFPVDKQFPDWIRDMAYGPVLGGGSHILGANLNPVTSVTEQLGNDPRRGITGMLTPFVRVPGELASQSDWQTGQPFRTMDKTEYIDKQIPLVSVANRLTGGNLAAGSVEALATGNPDAMLNHKTTENTAGNTQTRDAFLNYMIAAGIINTQSPANLKSAQYDQRDREADRRRKLRESLGG